MGKASSTGTCQFCHSVLSKGTMARHLESCAARTEGATTVQKKPTKKTRRLHLLVEGRDQPQYWMHVDLPAEATLQTLDDFLRRSWLECCGHLSKFEIAGTSYASHPDPEFDDKSMRVQTGRILGQGMQFFHEYDYGSTTELRLKVVAEREGEGKSIQVLARNEPPLIACEKCGKPATEVCSECIYDEGGWLCDACAEEHECGEEMLLPVVNSPRVGMCSYTGHEE